MATERYRKNVICQVSDSSGYTVLDHQGKSALFYQEFKARLGTSLAIDMQFDLQNIVYCHDDLEELCSPFTDDDINSVILDLPNKRAPGPDGFNGFFFKRAWHAIRTDFFALCRDFYLGTADLKSINSSYIALVPKRENPEYVSDYRPISLVSSPLKILAKLLANRLQSVALKVIHENQYDFIKGRTIQDCLA